MLIEILNVALFFIGLALMIISVIGIISIGIGICWGVPKLIKMIFLKLLKSPKYEKIDKDDIAPVTFSLVLLLGIICLTILINIEIPKAQEQVQYEIQNIVSYEGIANVKEGKYNRDYLYFTKGENNNYEILKIDPDKCIIHYIDEEEIRIYRNETVYLSKFKNLAMNIDSNVYYDVYIPNE